MNRNTVLLLLLIFSIPVAAQNVSVSARIDSLQILIGEQTKLKLEVIMGDKQHAILPQPGDTLVKGVEVLEVSKPDTQFVEDKQRLVIKQEYTITSFDSALYYLPPLLVKVDDKEYETESLALKVYSVPVDMEHPDQFFGPKNVMKPPFMWEDWRLLIILSCLLCPLAVLLVYFIIRLCDNKPIIRRVKVEPKIPPHILAMQEIERVKSEKTWQSGEAKAYYTELTDIIRTYISDRFGFQALEMTSAEIIDKLLELNQTEDIKDLKALFNTADLVKFAKHNPLMNENDMNLINAIDFINETREQLPEGQKPQPTEITIIEKRSLRARILIISGIVLLSVAIVGIAVYVVRELYYLL